MVDFDKVVEVEAGDFGRRKDRRERRQQRVSSFPEFAVEMDIEEVDVVVAAGAVANVPPGLR